MAVAGSGVCVSQHSALEERERGRVGVAAFKEKLVLEGQWAGGPGLLAARSFSEPNAHCRDEGSPLATTIFRQEEGHITFW